MYVTITVYVLVKLSLVTVIFTVFLPDTHVASPPLVTDALPLTIATVALLSCAATVMLSLELVAVAVYCSTSGSNAGARLSDPIYRLASRVSMMAGLPLKCTSTLTAVELFAAPPLRVTFASVTGQEMTLPSGQISRASVLRALPQL